MEPTAISLAARALRARLAVALPIEEGNVLVGQPSAASARESQVGRNFLNIFFFNIEQSGLTVDASSVDPFFVRLQCLVTAFGSDVTSGSTTVSAGENDLRIIGAVMAALHASPILEVSNERETAVAHLQIVPLQLTLDQMNHIWSTQVDVSSRPSVAYELALAPIPFERPVDRSPRVVARDLDEVCDRARQPLERHAGSKQVRAALFKALF
jgi:hypothetical protein